MSTYSYTDEDGDKLLIKEALGVLSHVYINVSGSSALYLPPSEAPKAAQAILDAAGVKGVVIVGSNINVTLGDTVRSIETKLKVHEEAAAKKAHDDLRTSPIALKALAIYNRGIIGSGPYASWDETNCGGGCNDDTVHYYIGQAEEAEAKEKAAAEKLAARRDALAKELCDGTSIGPWYEAMGTVHKRAIDRIIALEDKAA